MGVSTNLARPQSRKTVLPNGVQVLTEHLHHVDSVSLGVWLATGVEDEPAELGGITHFIEHMLFKGTETRSTLDIAEATDGIGGQVNAFTDRECMYLYARTIGEQAEEALELVFDLLLHSVFPEEEIAREQDVVVQEIGHLEDSPEDWVHEVLLRAAWGGHPLGRPLMGAPESVRGIQREVIVDHLGQTLTGDRLIVSAAGDVEHELVVENVARLASDVPRAERAPSPAGEAPAFQPERLVISRPTGQVHFCLGTPGCSRTDERRHAFAVLDTILGGGTSSRLFQEIRENRGLAYSIGCYLQAYRSVGLLTIDAGTRRESFELVLEVIGEEVERLRKEGPTPRELERAKTQLKVGLALAAESTSFRMQHLAVSTMDWDRVVSFEEIAAGVDAVTAEDVHDLTGAAFTPEGQALAAIGPFGGEGA